MDIIVIAPQGSSDPSADDLQSLADKIHADLRADVEVRSAKPWILGTAGVTFWEVVSVWVPWDQVRDMAAGAIITAFVGWARARFRSGKGRPKYGRILGPDGRVIRSVKLDKVDSEPEDLTEEDRARDNVFDRPD